MNRFILFFSTLLLFLLTACTENASTSTEDSESQPASSTTTIDYKKLSSSFCDCAQSLITLNKEMEALHSEGKNEEFLAMTPKIGQEFKATLECCRKAKEAQSSAAVEEQRVFTAISNNCPDIPQRLADQIAKQL
ncbi:MAG: hypothetical protein AAGG75_02780 [Bacteroidota bacterium]